MLLNLQFFKKFFLPAVMLLFFGKQVHTLSWSAVQREVQDAVVQIVVSVVQCDLTRPYNKSFQVEGRGSGFFIDQHGHIVTAAHVVEQQVHVQIKIPRLPDHIFSATVVGVAPDRDFALLAMDQHDVAIMHQELDKISFISLGDSDSVKKADDILCLGYPLGVESMKSTVGVMSGHTKEGLIQITTPINPGSSGGPALNSKGEVIGIVVSVTKNAQNTNFIVPIREFIIVENLLYSKKLVYLPFSGLTFVNTNATLVQHLHNISCSGIYIGEVELHSPAQEAGLCVGDVITEIDGYSIDFFGYMKVPWCEDKIRKEAYLRRFCSGDNISIVYYRDGIRYTTILVFGERNSHIIKGINPWIEQIDYEIFAGFVVTPLTWQHISLFSQQCLGLKRYYIDGYCKEPVLVISHIFQSSALGQLKMIAPGDTISTVNGCKVNTLADFREALKKSIDTTLFHMTITDQEQLFHDDVPCMIPLKVAVEDTIKLSKLYGYPISDSMRSLYRQYMS